jgi:hypothetical protein
MTKTLLLRTGLLVLICFGIIGAITGLKLQSAMTASPVACPPALAPSAGVETIFDTDSHTVTLHRFRGDGTSEVYRIDLDNAYSQCDARFLEYLASLRGREAEAHAVACGQKEAYLNQSLDPLSPLKDRLDYSAQTRQKIQEAYDRDCGPSEFEQRHWGITIDQAKSGIPTRR